MEPKLEGISRKVWNVLRVAIFTIKKGLCKKNLVMDLNFMMKRGKIVGKKALGNLMFHNNPQGGVGGPSNLSNDAREYEFNCSNTPLYQRYFTNKRKNHQNNDHYYMPSPLPLDDSEQYNLEDVNNVIEMIVRNKEVGGGVSAASPSLGFEQSSMDQDDKHVDQAAEIFIKDFYSQLIQQN